MKTTVFAFLAIIVLVSCKKDPELITFGGTVNDPYQNMVVPGALVTLQANGVVDGVYNASYVTLATTTSDAFGRFEFKIEESAYDSYRITLQKDGYYLSQKVLDSGNINPDSPYAGTFDFYSQAFVRMHIRNATPFDALDEITLFFQNNPQTCMECCSDDALSLVGMTIDTTYICQSVGGFNLLLFRSITKNDNSSTIIDTLTTVPMDTLDYEVLY